MADTASQYQPLLDQQAQERGTRYAEPMYPAGYSEAQGGAEELGTRLYKGGALPSAETTKEQMIQGLYEYDKKLDQANYSPFPQQTLISTGQPYIPNPADYSRAGAGYISALGGQANAFQRAIQNVETSYQDAINNLINRYIDFATLAEKRKQREEDKRAAEQNTLLEIMKVVGGDYTDPNTGRVYHFMSPEEKAILEKKYRAGGESGVTTEDTAILENILGVAPSGGQQPAVPQSPLLTEPKPTYSPAGGVGALSNGGQWIFDGQDWVPSGQTPSLESFWRNQ